MVSHRVRHPEFGQTIERRSFCTFIQANGALARTINFFRF